MIALLATALIAGSSPSCSSIDGTAALLDQPQRVIVVGEFHGTVEAPAAFLGVVCEAAQRGPVTVGLEMSETDRPLFDAFMASPDEATARRVLQNGDFGRPDRDDGRHSQAMMEMLLGFWRLRAAGHDIALHPFLPLMSVIHGREQAWRELEMAYGMSRALVFRPDARLLILVGDLHARKTAFAPWPDVGIPAAGHLHGTDTLTLHMAQQGGERWGCDQDGCGRETMKGVYDLTARGIILTPISDGAYDGVLAVGAITASPPAALSSAPAT
ncbi:MAG: hypothetical protein K2Y04_14855 [Caulobacteraceae bacterium]|nr:hypothetical protein [Caulobacteraceae bacterium]